MGERAPTITVSPSSATEKPKCALASLSDATGTSKCCLECGRAAKFFNYGVTYCTERDHHRMANRDVAAARKIGARYLATKKELDLGPWSRGVSAVEVEQGTHASPVLRDVLTSYARGEYFSENSQRLLQTLPHGL